jgi:peptide/nickel transport system permease protein
MKAYGLYFVKRLAQFFLVVFIGINIAFFVTHATPIDPVENAINSMSAMGHSDPGSVEITRQALRELYGLQGTIWDQYANFWKRIVLLDFGPSLSAFPTPVSELILRALPWTLALLSIATLLSWVIGNLLGGLAGYFVRKVPLKLVGVVAAGLQPIPNYIMAFVLLILFSFIWPVLPVTGAYDMNTQPGFSLRFLADVAAHALLPLISIILVAVGGWFIGMRALVSNIVTEDYVTYAELGGVAQPRILFSYILRNAMVPQITGLALSLGLMFNGAVITEIVFGYPGVGNLLVKGVYAGDYSLIIGIASVSIIAVALAVLVVDMIYPLLDPRVRLA